MRSFMKTINPSVRMIQCSEQDTLVQRAEKIMEELQQGVKKPYQEVINACWGDIHSVGMKPLTFVRQVIAACIYPELLQNEAIAPDARERAKRLLRDCEGGSIGSYSPTRGVPLVCRSVCEFISRRDGGVHCSPENVFLFSGSQNALMFVLTLLVNGEGLDQTGVLVPIPTYYTFLMGLDSLGAVRVPYYPCEEDGWELHVEELYRAVSSSQSHCSPRVLYVVNPGNPTGHVQTRKSMEEVIRFAAEKQLFLFADEVYQDTVYGDDREFLSYKKVLFEMGPQYSDMVELASFHSVSKGFIGECGLRCGYVELVNIDPSVKPFVNALYEIQPSPSIIGQIALNIMTDPPKPGDPSHPSFSQEVKFMKDTLVYNVHQVQRTVETLPGMSFQAGHGGIYAYLHLYLPPKALQKAKDEGTEADMLYCTRLLEEEGVCLTTGTGLGQNKGIHHIRMCILTPIPKIKELLDRLKSFHLRFLQQFD